LSQMALSLDFPDADHHDRFRGVSGAFDRTMQAIEWAHAQDLPLQINTTVCGRSAPYLEEMAALVQGLGIDFWEGFFLVPMGRGASLGGLDARQCEELFGILYRTQREADFLLKVTEAPHYRRYVMQRTRHSGLPPRIMKTEAPGGGIGLAPRGVNSGSGILFVSHTGDVFPSGFLPIQAGNVRRTALASIYRDSDIFRRLRRPHELEGACGRCEFNIACGGSRSRAYALTGNPLASDPWCVYVKGKQHAAALV